MEDWKQIWQSKKQISHSIIQQGLQDKEQNYYQTLTLMLLNPEQYYNEVFLQNIIEAILYHHDNSIQFTQMLRQFDSTLLRYKSFDFCKALFENKYICQTNKDYIVEIANKSLDNNAFLWYIIELMSLNQLKYHLKPILTQLSCNIHIRNTIVMCFHYFFTNDIDYNLSIQRSKINLKLTINIIKRAFKWDKENNYQQLANEIDRYFQKDLVTNEKHVLIAYLLTTERSTLSIQKPNLTKLLINGLKDQNSNIYLERILKFMRIHNHKDTDNSYKIGVNSLTEIQGELFRISWQFEKELEKLLSESTQKRNILKLIKNTFSREPFSFSQQFIINLIQLDYQQDPTLIKVFWSMIKKIYNFFFESLYDKNIINIYDFEGVFVDETGKPKLITKVGNMKKNAKKLVPHLSQLIINCEPILLIIQKKFIKLFLKGDKLQYFFLNFIYEPISVLNQQQSQEDICQVLYQILSHFIQKMMTARCNFKKYLKELKEFMNYHIQNKSQVNQKGLAKLTQNLQISDRQQLEIIDKIQSSILSKLRQGERVLSQIDEQLVQNILTSLEGNQSFYFDFPEYSIFIDILQQDIQLDNICNIQQPQGQLLILCLIRQHQQLFDDQFIIQSLNTLINNLPQILEISGYLREQQLFIQEYQEIERIDQNGDIYYEISNEIAPQQGENIYPTKNQKQLMIYLQLISILLQQNKEILDVELCVNTLRQLLKVYNSEDSYILQFWDISYEIINQLTPYTSDKWLEQEQNVTKAQINKFNIGTKDFIYCLIINQDCLEYQNIIQYLDLIRQLQGEQKKYIISLLLRKSEQYLNQEFFEIIYFKRNIQYEQIFVTQYFLQYILKQQPSIQQFTFVSQIFVNVNDQSIQNQMITMITQNLSILGLEYFILVFFGMYSLNNKIKSICKQYKGQFQKIIYDLDYNISGYCFLINSLLYLTSNCSQCGQLYFIFRKFFKLFLPRKNLNKIKHYMKKQMIIAFQFSAFFNEIGNFIPFPHNIDSIFKIIQINESKVPLTLSNSIGMIRTFDQIIELSQFCFNEICNAQRKQQIKDIVKLHQQTTDKCVDSRLFNYQPNSKNIKHNRNLPSISSPTVFYSDNKEIEKILKK